MYAKIHNPKTNRNVSIYSPLGKKILKSYLSKSGLLGGSGRTGLTEGLTDDQARAFETLNLLKQKGLHVSVAKQVSRINLPSRFNIGDQVVVLNGHPDVPTCNMKHTACLHPTSRRCNMIQGKLGRIVSMEAAPMYEQDSSLLSGQDPVGTHGKYNYRVLINLGDDDRNPLNHTVKLKEGEFWYLQPLLLEDQTAQQRGVGVRERAPYHSTPPEQIHPNIPIYVGDRVQITEHRDFAGAYGKVDRIYRRDGDRMNTIVIELDSISRHGRQLILAYEDSVVLTSYGPGRTMLEDDPNAFRGVIERERAPYHYSS